MQIRVMVVDDNYIVRDGLRAILGSENDVTVVALAETGAEAIHEVEVRKLHVILMDVSLNDMNGIEITRHVLQRKPDLKIVALSAYYGNTMIRDMFNAGAVGYIYKDDGTPDVLVTAIKSAYIGLKYMSKTVTDVVLNDFVCQYSKKEVPQSMGLTRREQEVLGLIAGGAMNKQIAENLGMAVRTVETHRHRITRKLNIYSEAELARYAVKCGLISL